MALRLSQTKWPLVALGTAVGAAAVYFYDPDAGKKRRHTALEKTKKGARSIVRSVQSAPGDWKQQATHLLHQWNDHMQDISKDVKEGKKKSDVPINRGYRL